MILGRNRQKSYLLKVTSKFTWKMLSLNLTNNFVSLKVISRGLKDSRIFFVHALMEDWIKRHDSRSLAKPALSEGKNFLYIYIRLFKNIRIFFIADTVYAAPAKKTTSGGGTLGRRTRRGHASALSSSSTASDRSETVFPDEHTRIHLTNGEATFRVSFTHIIAHYYLIRMTIASYRMPLVSLLETIIMIIESL